VILLLLASAAVDVPTHQAACFLSAALQHLLVLLPSFALSAAESFHSIACPASTSHCAFAISVVWPLLQTAAKFS
jgi:hypothetical protein